MRPREFYSREQGAIAQLGERLLCKQEVTGSIPVASTRKFRNAPSSDLWRRRVLRTTRGAAQPRNGVIVSIERDEVNDTVDVDRAWEQELRMRLAEVDAGTAELIPAEEVFAEMRNRKRR